MHRKLPAVTYDSQNLKRKWGSTVFVVSLFTTTVSVFFVLSTFTKSILQDNRNVNRPLPFVTFAGEGR